MNPQPIDDIRRTDDLDGVEEGQLHGVEDEHDQKSDREYRCGLNLIRTGDVVHSVSLSKQSLFYSLDQML